MRNIFITGISRGLGLQLTRHFLEQGDMVVGLSRTLTPELDDLRSRYPDRLRWFRFDLTLTDGLEQRLRDSFPFDETPFHIFIDNAAILYKNLIHRIDGNAWADMVAVNTVAPIILTKVMIANFLRFKTEGSIIHFSSICAHRAFNGLSMMAATKAAIEAFSRDTAHEYGRFGIRSNTIVAGLLEIGMKSTVNDKLTSGLLSISSLGRLVDTGSVVDMVDYLCSHKGRCITGQEIHINSGIV